MTEKEKMLEGKPYQIEVLKMADLDESIKHEVSRVFIEGYYNELSFFAKDPERLANAFEDAFIAEVFYLALIDGQVVGMLACANNKTRAMRLDPKKLRKALGFFAGSLAYLVLKNEFHRPFQYADDVAYIECVATGITARGQGVATALLNDVLRNLPYTEYILEVVDTNEKAFRIYQKLGFEEFERKPEKHAKQKGFNARIYMRKSMTKIS